MSSTSYELGQREQESRRVSSIIIEEQLLGEVPQETVRYVEVPYIEEVIRHVPKKEIQEIIKHVPKVEIQYVDREVIIPQIQYVDKTVEVPQIQYIDKQVTRKEIIEVPKEIVKTIPRIETKIVEQIVEVAGPIVEVPKPYTVENKVPVFVYEDKHEAVVVAQSLRPVIAETTEEVEIEVIEYEPEVIPVDVQVPKAVPAQLISKGLIEEMHQVVDVPHAHFNSLLSTLNPHLADREGALPFIRDGGVINFLEGAEKLQFTNVPDGVAIRGIENTPLGHRFQAYRGSMPNQGPPQAYSAGPDAFAQGATASFSGQQDGFFQERRLSRAGPSYPTLSGPVGGQQQSFSQQQQSFSQQQLAYGHDQQQSAYGHGQQQSGYGQQSVTQRALFDQAEQDFTQAEQEFERLSAKPTTTVASRGGSRATRSKVDTEVASRSNVSRSVAGRSAPSSKDKKRRGGCC